MKRARGKLTYGNVVATIALFLALTGGVVWAAHKIRSGQIARNAVKAKNIARGAVTSSKVKNGSLQRLDLAHGTLSGLPIADSSASNITVPLSGSSPTAIPLQGSTSFVARKGRADISQTPVAGDPKELLTEARATLTSGGDQPCNPDVEIDLNGLPVAHLTPSNDDPVAGAAVAAGLTQAGKTQTITAKVFPDSDCAAGSTIDQLRVVVVQYG
jgi:hypothetical protein